MAVNFGFNTPFAEQLDFFRAKLNLPSERWDDIQRSAHDRAFIVAGAGKADLLNDLRAAVDKAVADGEGLEAFRKRFKDIVRQNGWTGWTGEGSKAGVAWRTKVIYQTNMATSYAAGRYRQLTDPEFLKLRPWWRYVHQDGVLHPRPLHQLWGDMRLTLRHDDLFWKTHFPPNGWGCHCRVTPVDGPAQGDATAPPDGWDEVSPKTGAPVGIDRGFDYAPGASALRPLQSFVDSKLINLDAPVGAAMWNALAPMLAQEQRQALAEFVDSVAARMTPANNAALAHVVSSATVADLAARTESLVSADIWLRDSELIHALRESKTGRGRALSLQTWRDLPSLLESATPYLDTEDTALIYLFESPDGVGKVAIRINYTSKVQSSGGRDKLTSNFIRTGGIVDPMNVEKDPRFVKLEK